MPAAPSAALERMLSVLLCPVCSAPFEAVERTLRCPARHTFDIARQGYVGLLTGHRGPATADAPAMVRARTAFLNAGHYAPLATALAARATALAPTPDATLLDAGVGTGHYLAAALDALPAATGLGLDTSPHALRSAARIHPRAAAASWDVWRPLPLHTDSVHLLLNVFAPRNAPEFHRVLHPTGTLLVVTPTPTHLHELRTTLDLLNVDPTKEDRLHQTLSTTFRREDVQTLEYVIHLPAPDVLNLVTMTPSAHHISAETLHTRVAALPNPQPVTVSFTVSTFRPLN
ncbi:putative RNA methyltransferase [Streptomyces sp. NPDC020412]|uniref:putative RNA methyltransferase n=1 Tax=Streptomyces sp. NPDC020412 TaxID=3365073 RepID=UPI0037A5D2EA